MNPTVPGSPVFLQALKLICKKKKKIVGKKHYKCAQDVKETLQRYKSLQDIIAILGIDELSKEARQVVARVQTMILKRKIKKIQNFKMTKSILKKKINNSKCLEKVFFNTKNLPNNYVIFSYPFEPDSVDDFENRSEGSRMMLQDTLQRMFHHGRRHGPPASQITPDSYRWLMKIDPKLQSQLHKKTFIFFANHQVSVYTNKISQNLEIWSLNSSYFDFYSLQINKEIVNLKIKFLYLILRQNSTKNILTSFKRPSGCYQISFSKTMS